MNNMNVDQALAQMRSMQARMDQAAPSTTQTQPAQESGGFSELLKDAINGVNETQQTSGKLTRSFEAGDPDVSLVEVMVAKQKSDLAFTAVKEVRNKMVEAYKDIKNMPV